MPMETAPIRDFSSTKADMADLPSDQSRSKAALSALKPLIPYGLAYKGRIAAALAALVLASAATLVVPIAVRRVIDFGFSDQGRDYINAYFVLLMGGVLALWQAGVLEEIPGIWLAIGAVVAVGLGIMLAVSSSPRSVTTSREL